jgi:hypothetical protein
LFVILVRESDVTHAGTPLGKTSGLKPAGGASTGKKRRLEGGGEKSLKKKKKVIVECV